MLYEEFKNITQRNIRGKTNHHDTVGALHQ